MLYCILQYTILADYIIEETYDLPGNIKAKNCCQKLRKLQRHIVIDLRY